MDSPEGLLEACEEARRRGKDFPTVWNTILMNHPLVLGLPAHRVREGMAQIAVRLSTGQQLVSYTGGYALE